MVKQGILAKERRKKQEEEEYRKSQIRLGQLVDLSILPPSKIREGEMSSMHRSKRNRLGMERRNSLHSHGSANSGFHFQKNKYKHFDKKEILTDQQFKDMVSKIQDRLEENNTNQLKQE